MLIILSIRFEGSRSARKTAVTGASLTLKTFPPNIAVDKDDFAESSFTNTHAYGWRLKEVGVRRVSARMLSRMEGEMGREGLKRLVDRRDWAISVKGVLDVKEHARTRLFTRTRHLEREHSIAVSAIDLWGRKNLRFGLVQAD